MCHDDCSLTVLPVPQYHLVPGHAARVACCGTRVQLEGAGDYCDRANARLGVPAMVLDVKREKRPFFAGFFSGKFLQCFLEHSFPCSRLL